MKTLVLIGLFVTGEHFRQEMPDHVCLATLRALQAHLNVEAETVDGKKKIKSARCVDPNSEEIGT